MSPWDTDFFASSASSEEIFNEFVDASLVFSQVVSSVCGYRATLLPIRQGDILQSLIDIEPEILAIIPEPTIQPGRHFSGRCGHLF